jgi:hypothetical protein
VIICPIKAEVLLPQPFILMAPDFTSIKIDGQFTTLAAAAEYFFTVRVISSLFSGVQADYNLKVVLSACYVNNFSFTDTISDITYDTTLGTITTSPFQT